MIDIPDPPKGSAIRVERSEVEVRLVLRVSSAAYARNVGGAYLIVGSLFVVGFLFFLALADEAEEIPIGGVLAMLVVLLLNVIILASFVARTLFPSPETITLRPDQLVFVEGVAPLRNVKPFSLFSLRSSIRWRFMTEKFHLPFCRRPRASISRSDVTGVRASADGDEPVAVILKAGRDPLLVGRFVGRSDRDYLASVLRHWLGARP